MTRERMDGGRTSLPRFQVGFLVANLLLTLVLGAQSLHAVFQKPEYPAVKSWPDAAALQDAGPPAAAVSLANRAVEIGRRLEASPAAVVPREPPPGAAPRAVEESGPLEKDWELSMSLVSADPQQCFCVLRRKEEERARAVRSPASIQRAKLQKPPVPACGDMKMLKVNDRWTDAERGIDIRVLEVAKDLVRYEDLRDGSRAVHALTRTPRVPEFWKELPR